MDGEQYAQKFKTMEEVVERHSIFSRYNSVLSYCKNKNVVDVGCVGGHGTYMISDVAKKVLGVDLIKSHIDWCNKYWSKENIEYFVFDVVNEKLPDIYDVIVMCECIEHLSQTIEITICKMYDVLNDDGLFCFTFPENEKPTISCHQQFNIKRKDVCVFLEDNGFKVIEEFLYDDNGSFIIAKKEKNE